MHTRIAGKEWYDHAVCRDGVDGGNTEEVSQ